MSRVLSSLVVLALACMAAAWHQDMRHNVKEQCQCTRTASIRESYDASTNAAKFRVMETLDPIFEGGEKVNRVTAKVVEVFKGCLKEGDVVTLHSPGKNAVGVTFGACGVKIRKNFLAYPIQRDGKWIVEGACAHHKKWGKVGATGKAWLRTQGAVQRIMGNMDARCSVLTQDNFEMRTADLDAEFDLSIDVSRMSQNMKIDFVYVTESSCEWQEKCVGGLGFRKVLRFDAKIDNLGNKDFKLGLPFQSSLFEFSACHGHYHAREFSNYRLRNLDGSVAAVGHKQSFCLMDIEPISTDASNPRYDCDNQGISKGWSDVYEYDLPCQWVDITDVPDGDYVLQVELDPAGFYSDPNPDNNNGEILINIENTIVV